MLLRMAEAMLGLRASSLENPSTSLANPAKWLLEWAGGGKSAAGVTVTEEKAQGVATAYACGGLIARSMMTLPIHVYRRVGKFSEPAPDHWSQPLLSEAPNGLHTSVVWMQLIATHACFWGSHYAAIDMAPDGTLELIPLIPKHTRAVLLSSGKRKKYVTQLADGTEKEFREDEVLHFPVPAINGNAVTGVRPIQTLRNLFGHRIAAEDFNSRFFANDARPGVILETPGSMDEVAQKSLVESLYQKYTGAENRWKVLVLEEGAKMHTVQMPLKDAQFLESILADDVQICGAFGVPPHMVGITEKSTAWGTGLVEMFLGYAKLTMLPWCRVIEAELKRKFYAGTEYFAKFNLEGLQRGDYKSRMEGYQLGINNGVMLIDEARELEDMPPLEKGLGKIAFITSNVQTIENAKKEANGAPEGGAPMDNEEKQLLRDLAAEVRASHEVPAPSATNINATFHLPETMTHKLDIPAPQVQVHNEVNPTPVHVAAPKVTVENKVEVPEVRVEVAAPNVQVQVEAPVVNNDVRVEQQPVEVNVHLPARKSTSEIERDQHGAIKKVTTTEKDVK